MLRTAFSLSAATVATASACWATGNDPRQMMTYSLLADLATTSGLALMDPETAHAVTMRLLRAGFAPVEIPFPPELEARLATQVLGLDFNRPVGLAAGFDKQGEAVQPLLNLGFGFVEVGGVTPQPQPGNPKPRMFRLPEDRAVINRFGLNSEGSDVVASRLAAQRAQASGKRGVVGVNLAKNTASEDAVADYVAGVQQLGAHVDFVVVNVSCPNVKWTSSLSQDGDAMLELVRAVKQARDELPSRPALLLKLGPDMCPDTQEAMAKLALACQVDGLVVSNTTSARPASLISAHASERGGLSGKPLQPLALDSCRQLYRLTNGKIPIIGVGGIASGEDAYKRIRAGASLVQLYTALAYHGPGLVRKINGELAILLARDGFNSVAEAVGADVKLPNQQK